jgi:archaemetzincin
MMKLIHTMLVMVLIMAACTLGNRNPYLDEYTDVGSKTMQSRQKVIGIVPLGEVSTEYLTIAKSALESFYGFSCEIRPQVALKADLLTKSKTRYDANSILKKFNSDQHLLIITEKDIATRKNNHAEWGILGLGYLPGKTCVVSTFRMKRNATRQVVEDRFEKICLHEIGHNLGLGHCDYDSECLMNDVRGNIKQVDKEKKWLCKKCCGIIKVPFKEKPES